MIDVKVLAERTGTLNIEKQLRDKLLRWVGITAEELDGRRR